MNHSFCFAVGKVPLYGHLVTNSSVCEFFFIFKKKKKSTLCFSIEKKKVKDQAIFQVKDFFLLVNRTQDLIKVKRLIAEPLRHTNWN